MTLRVRKAVFPVAGLGTRFLPATKAMPKELLPVVDKPLIQYAVEEAIAAGIDTLIFVTGRHKRAIEDHFDSNHELSQALIAKGKVKEAEMIENILPKGVECIFVRQPNQLGLGDAILCAERVVGDEPFAVLLADDFLRYEGNGVIMDLIKNYEKTHKTQLCVLEINGPAIEKYGVLILDKLSGSVLGLIEKPKMENAPSNLASIGRYILTPDIFEILRNQPIGFGGELQLADAINSQAKNLNVDSVMLNGLHFDCGNKRDYVAAIEYVSKTYKFSE